MNKIRLALFSLVLFISAVPLLAQASPSPVPSSYPLIISSLQGQAATATVQTKDFLSSVVSVVGAWGGLNWYFRTACLLLLIIGTVKVSILDDLFWKRLGAYQALLAPALGLVSGLIILAAQNQLSMPGAFAFLGTGVGAVALHELLDVMKGLPGIGPTYVSVIAAIERVMGGNPVPNPDPSQIAADKQV